MHQGYRRPIQCHRCNKLGHMARDCFAHLSPREGRFQRPGLQDTKNKRRTITNLEQTERADNQDDYCGNTWGGASSTHKLPSYHARLGGRPAHVLLDSGATQNYVAAGFLREDVYTTHHAPTDKVTLTDGTQLNAKRTHTGLTLELGKHLSSLDAVEMPLHAFDAILGIPWLTNVRPDIDWGTQYLRVGGVVIHPVYRSPTQRVECPYRKDHRGSDPATVCGPEDLRGAGDKEGRAPRDAMRSPPTPTRDHEELQPPAPRRAGATRGGSNPVPPIQRRHLPRSSCCGSISSVVVSVDENADSFDEVTNDAAVSACKNVNNFDGVVSDVTASVDGNADDFDSPVDTAAPPLSQGQPRYGGCGEPFDGLVAVTNSIDGTARCTRKLATNPPDAVGEDPLQDDDWTDGMTPPVVRRRRHQRRRLCRVVELGTNARLPRSTPRTPAALLGLKAPQRAWAVAKAILFMLLAASLAANTSGPPNSGRTTPAYSTDPMASGRPASPADTSKTTPTVELGGGRWAGADWSWATGPLADALRDQQPDDPPPASGWAAFTITLLRADQQPDDEAEWGASSDSDNDPWAGPRHPWAHCIQPEWGGDWAAKDTAARAPLTPTLRGANGTNDGAQPTTAPGPPMTLSSRPKRGREDASPPEPRPASQLPRT